jgi:flagellar capping protein FliD
MADVSIETDVELLKRDVVNVQEVLTRLDSAIDKIADVSNGINKILAVHDSTIDGMRESFSERMNRTENDIEIIHDRISRHEDELKKEFREYHEEMKTMYETIESRTSVLEKWKWYIMGSAWGVGFLIATLLQAGNFLAING